MARTIFESRVAIDGIDIAFAGVHGADMEDGHFMRIAFHLYRNGYRKAPDVVYEALDAFWNDLMDTFIAMCEGNDYNKINLLTIGDTINTIYDRHIEELGKKYTEDVK
jgi:hypothetical protein